MNKKIVLLISMYYAALWADHVVLIPYTYHLGQLKFLFFLDSAHKEIKALHDIVMQKDDPVERAARVFSQQTRGAFGKHERIVEQGIFSKEVSREEYHESIEKIRESLEQSISRDQWIEQDTVTVYFFELPYYVDARTIERRPLFNATSLGKEYRRYQFVWIGASLLFKKGPGTVQIRPFRIRGALLDGRTRGWLTSFARHRSFELQELIELTKQPTVIKKNRRNMSPRRRAVRAIRK